MPSEHHLSQLRLLLEELCCDIAVFEHIGHYGLSSERVHIDREFPLDRAGRFADIRVAVPYRPPYFIEVKFGHPVERILERLRPKYTVAAPGLEGADRLVVVHDRPPEEDPVLESALRAELPPTLSLELWGERRLVELLRQRFGVEIPSISETNLLDVREAVERAKGYWAFGGASAAQYRNDALNAELLWHLDFWRLRQLREAGTTSPRQILPPRLYAEAVVVVADLCSFSSYVRDTREEDLVRHCLTSFYSKARYQIIKSGGLLYQIVGDAVVGLFGIPDRTPRYVQNALEAAEGLRNVGASVSQHWQRHIDHAQPASGLRIGIAMGDVQLVSLRPFSRTHMGVVGDAINIAARLQKAAAPQEVVVSNVLHNALPGTWQTRFQPMPPVRAHNLGRIRAWRLPAPEAAPEAPSPEGAAA